jgi:Right handed beta helix region
LARTWVSSLGNDGNDCNRLTPCRTFQRAHDQTLPLGEITVIDPGGYGAVNITKGISIINDGVGEAGTLVSGGLVGITINAQAGDHVTLRGLTVKGIGFGGGNGIIFNSGASLTIENCVVRNLTGDAISMRGNVAASTKRTLTLSNTLVTDNDANAIYVQPSGSGIASVVANRVEMYNNGAHGLALDGQKHELGGFFRHHRRGDGQRGRQQRNRRIRRELPFNPRRRRAHGTALPRPRQRVWLPRRR